MRELKGVITVEMSYILPMIIMIFATVMYTIFYFHDKNVILGAAAETAVVGAQMERKPDENKTADLNEFYQQRIAGKLILFSGAKTSVDISEKQVSVSAAAQRGRMRLEVRGQAPVTHPEKKIRRKRLLETMGESTASGQKQK